MAAVWGLEAQTEIQKRLDAADLGYLRMDIVDPFCGVSAWGLFNDRPLDPQKVESIRKSYHLMGPLACQNDKVIYLPMNPAWFVGPTTPVIAGKYVYQVPLLELTPAGKQALADGEFHPLSGNHRRAALVLYYEDLQESLKLLNEELRGIGVGNGPRFRPGSNRSRKSKKFPSSNQKKKIGYGCIISTKSFGYGTISNTSLCDGVSLVCISPVHLLCDEH